MYAPVQTGLPREFRNGIEYHEYLPRTLSQSVVHCLWMLRSRQSLADDFQYLVLPDGSIDIIFDIRTEPDFTGALIMTSDITATSLNLGKSFAYIGIRVQPGSWLQLPVKSMGQSVQRDSLGAWDLEQLRQSLVGNIPIDSYRILEDFTLSLLEQTIICENNFMRHLLARPVATVEDIVAVSGYSRRQVQRLIRERTGYSPHDLLRIFRFQNAIASMKADAYADQPHFIRDFKRITGMTPGEFRTTYLF